MDQMIDNAWYPHGNYEEHEITPRMVEKHISIRDDGYYNGSYPDIASSYGYCLTMRQHYEIVKVAEYATKPMAKAQIIGMRGLTKFEQAHFDRCYSEGFMKGQTVVAEQLYELAQMGDFKAMNLFLEVRGAFAVVSGDSGPLVQISLAEGTVIDHEEDAKIVQFKQS